MRLLFAVAGCFLQISLCCASQILNQYHTGNFTNENSLSRNGVNHITTESSGILWLVAEIRLVRYDGCRFKTYDKSAIVTPQRYVVELGKAGRHTVKDPEANLRLSPRNAISELGPHGIHIPFRWDFLKQPARIFGTSDRSVCMGLHSGPIACIQAQKLSHLRPEAIAKLPNIEIVWFQQDTPDQLLNEMFSGLQELDISVEKLVPAKQLEQKPIQSIYTPGTNAFGETTYWTVLHLIKNSKVATYNLHFHYNLTPEEEEKPILWLNGDKKEEVSAYHLPQGDNIMYIHGGTNLGNSQVRKPLYTGVQKHLFSSWVSILATSLTFLGLLAGIIRWRTVYPTEQDRWITKNVTGQTHELPITTGELGETETKLAKQLKIQSMIVGVMSHDIRSPLKFLSSSTQKLCEDTEKEFPDFPYLNTEKLIWQSANQVLALTDNLLKLIKLMLSESEIAVEKVSVNELLYAKRDFFAEIARNNDTVIEIMLTEELVVETNRQMLDIVIHNLLDNAVKSTFKDTIQLSAVRETAPDTICIVVADTGDGMPVEIAHWLGDSRFGHTSEPDIPGIGFGLIIVKEFSRLLNIPVKAGTTNMGTIVQLLVPPG